MDTWFMYADLWQFVGSYWLYCLVLLFFALPVIVVLLATILEFLWRAK